MPNAKRPQTIELVMTPDGPAMNVDQLNAAVCTLQRQMAAMEPWANGVSAALGEDAGHIDHRATVVGVQRVHMAKSLGEHNQLKADLITVVSDVCKQRRRLED